MGMSKAACARYLLPAAGSLLTNVGGLADVKIASLKNGLTTLVKSQGTNPVLRSGMQKVLTNEGVLLLNILADNGYKNLTRRPKKVITLGNLPWGFH